MPTGQKLKEGGVKKDGTKRRMDLIPASLLSGLSKVLEFGASKYGDHNWREGLKWSRLYAAAQRHLVDFWDGEDYDKESHLLHLYHAACNIAFLIEMYDKRPDLDDRYKLSGEIPLIEQNLDQLQKERFKALKAYTENAIVPPQVYNEITKE